MAGRFGALRTGRRHVWNGFWGVEGALVKPGAPAERFGALKSLGLKHAERYALQTSPRALLALLGRFYPSETVPYVPPARSACLSPWDLSAPNLPAIFGLFQLRPGSFSTSFSFLISFPKDQLRCCLFFLLVHLCLSLSLSISLSLFFSFT